MSIILNDLESIHFRNHARYAKAAPTFVSCNMGAADEVTRWVLDLNSVLYEDEPHAPHLYIREVNRLADQTGIDNTPVLEMTDVMLYKPESIILYYEQRCQKRLRLIPEDPALKQDMLDWYNLFMGELDDRVGKYMFGQMLTSRKLAIKVFTRRVPTLEKWKYRLGFSFIRKAMKQEMNLDANTAEERMIESRKLFGQVSDRLDDGRRYLTSDHLTLADIAFAAIAAPMILPVEFGGVIPEISEIPAAYRAHVNEMRKTAAGQFVMRLYREDRPTSQPQSALPGKPGALKQRIGIFLAHRQPGAFYFLQKHFPVLNIRLAHIAAVNRNDLLMEMLEKRIEDFTVEEVNNKKMSDQKGAFFLGMDPKNPLLEQERNFARRASKREDLERIRTFVRGHSEALLTDSKRYGRIDVAATLAKPVLVRLLEDYFGVPGPSDPEMMAWHRALFYDLFLNFTNNAEKHQLAMDAALARQAWIDTLIQERKAELLAGKTLPDNMLNRMLVMQQEPGYEWVDDDTVNRNIGGLLTGIFETTNKAVVFALNGLFDEPGALQGAIAAARAYDMQAMCGYVAEALRFNPVQPGVPRYCESEQTLTGTGTKAYTIPAKTRVFGLTSSAMFDPAAFPEPKKFNPKRGSTYMNWGVGLHECYGKYINMVTIPELVAAVLRLPDVQRAPGMTGRGTGIMQESFPNNFVVQFHASSIMNPESFFMPATGLAR